MTENEAIERVEEFGLHHAIGDLPYSTLTVKAFEMAIEALKEIQQYRAIGTVEECREARERQRAKKPIPIDYKKYMNTVKNAIFLRGAFWCPNCNRVVRSGDYCNDCGQAIDWSDFD